MTSILHGLTSHRRRGGTTPSLASTVVASIPVMTRLLLAAAGCAAAMPPRAFAQPPALVVDGEAITDDDIAQRTKFNALANKTSPTRREIIGELIDDKLKVQDASRHNIVITNQDVDARYDCVAKRVHVSPDEITQWLGQRGIDDKTLKAKLRADLAWYDVTHGLFGTRGAARPQAGEQCGNGEVASLKKGDIRTGNADVEYDYTLRPILFLVPRGDAVLLEALKNDAEALRARFTNCDSGLQAARAQPDVVIRDPINKNSSDLVYALRELLARIELGHLTPPETTPDGVQLFAVCSRKERTTGERSEARLRELRRRADISYIRDDVRSDIPYDRFRSVPGNGRVWK